jgi:glycosyltransferase involved in cell wall biosynthesis
VVDLLRHYPKARTTIIPNGVDSNRFRPDAEARRRIRAELGGDDATFVVLFVGGDWLRKGLNQLIHAVADLEPTVDGRVELWVAGEHDARWAEGVASRAGLGDRMRLLGFRDDIEAVDAAADVLVLPSRYETFGLVALEAAACGLPVVGTATAVRETFGSQERDSLTLDGTTSSIVSTLRRLAEDPIGRMAIGRQLLARATELSWDRTVEATERAYGDLLAESRVA